MPKAQKPQAASAMKLHAPHAIDPARLAPWIAGAQSPADFVERANQALRIPDYRIAEAVFQAGLKQFPRDPDILTERAILLCFLQREDDAVPILEKVWGTERSPRLAEMLSAYYFCRRQMAAKLGIEDAKGRNLEARVRRFVPDPPEGIGITISACLIVKNEEKHLERCLKSIHKHVDEIVVVDTGSTDRTIEIAERFGAKIGTFAWINDFAAARNESLRLASGHWALWVDADEEVAEHSWGAIREGVIRPHFGAYYIQMDNFMSDGTASLYTHCPVRLFQLREGVEFTGRIHEQVMPSITRLGLESATLENAKIRHYGYQPETMKEKNKADRAISMLEREVRESPQDAFHWFNLANAYCVANRLDDALHAARMSLRTLAPNNSFGSVTYHIIQGSLCALGRPAESLEAAAECREKGFFTILNQFEYAHALLLVGRLSEALTEVDVCLTMPWERGMTGDYGIVTHKTHHLKSMILASLGRYEEALDLCAFVQSVAPDFTASLFVQATALEKLGRIDEAEPIYTSLLQTKEYRVRSCKGLAHCALARQERDAALKFLEQAIAFDDRDAQVWFEWINLLEETGDADAKVAAFERFGASHTPTAAILVNWGRALGQVGRVEEAVAKFAQAAQQDPKEANAYFNLGDLLYQAGAYADAAHVYELGLRVKSDHAPGWFVLGNALAQLDLLSAAATAYRQALEIDPDYEQARHNLEIVEEAASAA
ncbi:MAG: tetratricopeptide repeat protein [Fimbriimonadaceae bacterium]